MTKKHSKNNYSDNAMKTIAYIMSTYHIGTYDLDIRDVYSNPISLPDTMDGNQKRKTKRKRW